MVLGGYGNFGRRIAEGLAQRGVPVIVAGRRIEEARRCAAAMGPLARAVRCDVSRDLDTCLAAERPVVVVNTCGPFQGQGYELARQTIRHGIHYLDLADGRDYVGGFASALHEEALANGIAAITGVSTVPALSSAVIERYRPGFASIDSLDYGISPGQRAGIGEATAAAILGYAGRRLRPWPGSGTRYGWQHLHRQSYPVIGKRWMAECEIPDLDLLPDRYGIRRLHFYAGLEIGLLHFGLWSLSWLVRLGLPLNLRRLAGSMLRVASRLDRFGTGDSGMHMILKGRGLDGGFMEQRWFILARHCDGPQIPCVPAIVMARRLVAGETCAKGAYPCVGLVSLDAYMSELEKFEIATCDG